MSSSEFSNPESLDALTEMLNQTLIETGRFFRSGGSLQSRAQLKRVLPQSQGQFQYALDNLSEQIFVAKAFLERDYEVVKARKAALRKRPLEDVAMEEPEAQAQVVPGPEQTTAGTVPSQESKPVENEVKMEEQAEVKNSQEIANASAEGGAHGAGAAAQDAQNAGDSEQGLYDSLLNHSESNEFGIDLDFGDDANAGNENFFNANFGDPNAGAGLEGGNQMSNTEAGHDNSAMPTGGDAFDLELQKFTNQDPNEQFGDGTEDIMGPGESSFDDLFMENENMGGNDDGDNDLLGGDLMQLNELDDSWFQ